TSRSARTAGPQVSSEISLISIWTPSFSSASDRAPTRISAATTCSNSRSSSLDCLIAAISPLLSRTCPVAPNPEISNNPHVPRSVDPDIVEFGKLLRRLRLDSRAAGGKEPTVHWVATRIQSSPRSLYAYYDGTNLISNAMLDAYLEVLDVPLDEQKRIVALRNDLDLERPARRATTIDRNAALRPSPSALFLPDSHLRTAPPWTGLLVPNTAGAAFSLGAVQRLAGRYRAAISALTAALECSEATHDLLGQANCLSYRGVAHGLLGA